MASGFALRSALLAALTTPRATKQRIRRVTMQRSGGCQKSGAGGALRVAAVAAANERGFVEAALLFVERRDRKVVHHRVPVQRVRRKPLAEGGGASACNSVRDRATQSRYAARGTRQSSLLATVVARSAMAAALERGRAFWGRHVTAPRHRASAARALSSAYRVSPLYVRSAAVRA